MDTEEGLTAARDQVAVAWRTWEQSFAQLQSTYRPGHVLSRDQLKGMEEASKCFAEADRGFIKASRELLAAMEAHYPRD